MLRENIQSLSESVFQRKQKCLCSVIYLQFLAAAAGILLLRKSKDRKWGGQLDFCSVSVPCSEI